MKITRRELFAAVAGAAVASASQAEVKRTSVRIPGGISPRYLREIAEANKLHFVGLSPDGRHLNFEFPAKHDGVGIDWLQVSFPAGPEQLSVIPYIVALNDHAVSIGGMKFHLVYDKYGCMTSNIGIVFRAEEV